MSKTPVIQPERYKDIESAEKYNAKIEKARGTRKLSRMLELYALKRALATIEGESVLDAPCGTGRIDDLLRARFKRIEGLDSSDAMLAVYRQGQADRKGHQGDIFNLPFAPKTFDWVVSHRLFHHFDNDETRLNLLKSMAQAAKQGVVFYAWIDVPFAGRGKSRRKTVAYEDLMKLIQEAGLEFQSIHYAFWPFQPKAILVCRTKGE